MQEASTAHATGKPVAGTPAPLCSGQLPICFDSPQPGLRQYCLCPHRHKLVGPCPHRPQALVCPGRLQAQGTLLSPSLPTVLNLPHVGRRRFQWWGWALQVTFFAVIAIMYCRK